MFSREQMQRAIEDALKQMEGVALELYRRGREEAREELEEARARNADMRAMLEQVTRERDEARASCPDCAMWAERSARWHDDMQRAERERDEARADLARSVAAWEAAGMQGRTAHDALIVIAEERDKARAERDAAIARISEVGVMVATNGNLLAKDAYRRGAEAMREAAANALDMAGQGTLCDTRECEHWGRYVRNLPIPEEP